MIAPDTQQNILYTVYFILLHNLLPVIYTVGIVTSILWAFYKPSRSSILLMLGFIVLLLAFEYNKHILEPLKQQTINSLITERQSYRIERIVTVTLSKLVPLGLPLSGWGMVIIGGFIESKKVYKFVQYYGSKKFTKKDK